MVLLPDLLDEDSTAVEDPPLDLSSGPLLCWQPRPRGNALADPLFRRAIAATWRCDLACYSDPADQVDLPRLIAVLCSWPQGLSLWMQAVGEGRRPRALGYSLWYPLTPDGYALLRDRPQEIHHRGQLWPHAAGGLEAPLYLFNYSVLPALRGGLVGRALMQGLALELQARPHGGLSAIAVSEDGVRAARRFGLVPRGRLPDGDLAWTSAG
jgi:GNAT superfamily N-acetyltransferase